jgi:hypothetical protein
VADLTEIVRLRDNEGCSWQEIAERCGLSSRDAAARAYTRGKGEAITEAEIPSPTVKPSGKARLTEVVDLAPQPFAVPIPRPARSSAGQSGKYQTAVVYTDTHFPHHSQAALDVVLGIIRDVRPSRVIHLGDLLDCYTISAFVRDRKHIYSLQDEIDQARAHMHQVAQIVPEAEKVWLCGNHEDRLDRLLNGLSGTAGELNRLRIVQEQLTWPVLMGLEDIGWEFVPVMEQTSRQLLPKLITKHGDVVRRWSGMSAKGEWERYGRSGLSGHVHRVGSFYTSDANGNHVWQECGCTCDLKPAYTRDPNWANACVLVHHTPDGERFAIEPVYIEGGRALYRSTEYRAA